MKEASPAALTHLAACYSQKINKRFVFFQDSESYIFAYDIEGNRGWFLAHTMVLMQPISDMLQVMARLRTQMVL